MTTDGRQLLRELQPREPYVQRDSGLGIRENPYPSIFEDTGFIRFVKGLDIRHATPEFRFDELGQVDPAGRYRILATTDSLRFQRALTANWATNTNYFQLDNAGGIKRMALVATERLSYPASLVVFHAPVVSYRGGSNSGEQYEFGGNNSSSVYSAVAQVDSATDPAGANFPSWKFVNRPVNFVDVALTGGGTNPFVIQVNPAVTGTARRFGVDVLDTTAGGVHRRVAQGVPNTTTPLWTMFAPNVTPTTSEVDATNLTWTVTAALHLIANFNSAGAMKTLDVGVLA